MKVVIPLLVAAVLLTACVASPSTALAVKAASIPLLAAVVIGLTVFYAVWLADPSTREMRSLPSGPPAPPSPPDASGPVAA